jgi:hypothetical protein
MQSQLQRVEIEPLRRRDDDLAVDDATGGQQTKQRLVQLGKVAVQRPQIAALDEHIVITSKDDGAEPVPLRLVEQVAVFRKHLG